MNKILIVDDDEAYADSVALYLSSFYSDVRYVTSGQQAFDQVRKNPVDVVITDLKMPGMDGFELLKKIKEYDINIAVITITAYADSELIIKAMQLGAYDFFSKSSDLKHIKFVVDKTLENKENEQKMIIPLETGNGNSFRDLIIGDSSQMKEVCKKIGKISQTRVNVLIYGESGTGKELIARLIHYKGITRNEPFIPVNCSALSESLLESELFGHVKGAFTGAIRDKKGKFELAGNGTIFLDEVSEFSSKLQVKLLRVIQEREFERVGSEETTPVKARIVVATNKNISEMVQKGEFRQDLYYRLKIFTIDLPPLRERKDDIYKLVVHFLHKINAELHKQVRIVPFEVMELLKNHYWIGNVRELENTLMNAVLLAKSDILEKENIIFSNVTNTAAASQRKLLTLSEAEKDHIKYILDTVNWNKSKACKILGITKATLYKKIGLYRLDPNN